MFKSIICLDGDIERIVYCYICWINLIYKFVFDNVNVIYMFDLIDRRWFVVIKYIFMVCGREYMMYFLFL